MPKYERLKKLTDEAYSATVATSEAAIRAQVDGSIEEIQDILYSTENGKGASQVGIEGTSYETVQEVAEALEAGGTGTIPPANSIGNGQLKDDVKVGSLAALLTTIKTSVVNAINELLVNLNIVRLTPTDTGAANAYVVSTAGTFSRVEGNTFSFIPSNANTGASTINEDGNGIADIRKWVEGVSTALEEGDLPKFQKAELVWNSSETDFFYAPKGGANPMEQWLNTTSVGDTSSPEGLAPTSRIIVNGSGWIVGLGNPSAIQDDFTLKVDGVGIIGDGLQSVCNKADESGVLVMIRYESSFEYKDYDNTFTIFYVEGDVFEEATPKIASNSATGAATNEKINVTGEGWFYGGAARGRFVRIVIDGVEVTSGLDMESMVCMFKFNASLLLLDSQATGSGTYYSYTLLP